MHSGRSQIFRQEPGTGVGDARTAAMLIGPSALAEASRRNRPRAEKRNATPRTSQNPAANATPTRKNNTSYTIPLPPRLHCSTPKVLQPTTRFAWSADVGMHDLWLDTEQNAAVGIDGAMPSTRTFAVAPERSPDQWGCKTVDAERPPVRHFRSGTCGSARRAASFRHGSTHDGISAPSSLDQRRSRWISIMEHDLDSLRSLDQRL